MNKKLKKLKNRLVETIQANYSIEFSNDKNKQPSSRLNCTSLINDKIKVIHRNSVKSKSKRVYLTDISQAPQQKNENYVQYQKEEIPKNNQSHTQLRYISRAKSSNGMSINRSLRQTTKLDKISKNINIQFQNQLYWSGNNSYLVTGVKTQYEKIKKSYDEKCLQIQNLKKEFKADTVTELKLQVEKLKKQNSRMLQALHKIRSRQYKYEEERSTAAKIVLQKNQAQQNQNIMFLQQKYERIQKKNQTLERKNQNLLKQNKQLLSKIYLLDKLIIEKQNNEFRAHTKCKKMEKLSLQSKEKYEQIENKLKNEENKKSESLFQLKLNLKQQYSIQKGKYLEQIRERDSKIIKLEKQINYIKTLLEQWTHNEESQMHENQEKQNSKQDNNYFLQYNTKHSLELQTDRFKTSKQNNRIKFKNSIDKEANQSGNRFHQNISQRSLNKNGLNIKFQNCTNEVQIQKAQKRQRVTAKINKAQSIKCRPIQLNQVQSIIQYLKLKLSYQKINPERLKEYFKFKKSQQDLISLSIIEKQADTKKQQKQNQLNQLLQENNVELEKIPWEHEYVTLKQVHQTFLKQPFQLKQSQALLLSRFVVEDVKEPYIYMNWDNQNSRRIVQSIVSNLLHFQPILEITLVKSEQLLIKFEPFIIPALKSISGKSPRVTVQKFIEILNGLGLQRNKFMDQYIIGKMCSHSQNLQQLQFNSLYNKKQNL